MVFQNCSNPEKNPPSFLVILVDDLGIKDLGCYGQEYIETPNIDRLAAEGMRWTNAYSSCPVCSPTRAALLTGKNPARLGFTGHITAIGKHRHPENSTIIPPDDNMFIPLKEITIAEALKPAGYASGSFGKWHVGFKGYWPEDQGFDLNVAGWTHGSPPAYFYPYERPGSDWNAGIPTLEGGVEGEYLPDRLTDEAIQFIENNRENPFLLYLPYYAVHTPLQAPEDLVEKYRSIVPGTPIDPTYAAMVERVDYNVGRILQCLEELELDNNTVVIFASDNGGLETVTDNSPYRRGKGHLYEAGIRVPFIMRWPGRIPESGISENRTISCDIFETILDIAKRESAGGERVMDPYASNPGGNPDARSLWSDFDGTLLQEQADLFWYYPHYGIGQDPGSIIISGDYKLIEHYDPPNIELFNLREDIGEATDLSETNAEKREELLTKLHKWLKDIDPVMHKENPLYINANN